MQNTSEITKGFAGVRTRFQRLSDYRFFVGWVQDFFGERILIRSSPDVVLLTGQEFQFEVFGTEKTASFRARLEYGSDFGLYDPNTTKAEFEMRQRVLAAADVEFEFVLLGKPVFRDSTEASRHMLQSPTATITNEEFEIVGAMIDASELGAGLGVNEQVAPGAEIHVKVETHLGEIRFKGKVRYCKPDKQGTHAFRVGVQIESIDRIDRARWAGMLST